MENQIEWPPLRMPLFCHRVKERLRGLQLSYTLVVQPTHTFSVSGLLHCSNETQCKLEEEYLIFIWALCKMNQLQITNISSLCQNESLTRNINYLFLPPWMLPGLLGTSSILIYVIEQSFFTHHQHYREIWRMELIHHYLHSWNWKPGICVIPKARDLAPLTHGRIRMPLYLNWCT